jgi:hypothetical protein
MTHQTSGNQAKLTRVQLEEHIESEHKDEKKETFDEDISLEEALSTL